ncbi:MAG: sporulation integral membrane protein YtvI, partial [Clostridiales bacterium]|nr:sporulation integral membrane protein YtvI [Clostridiales bacterium]
LFAILIAAILQKPIRTIERKTKWNHAFVSVSVVLLLLLLIIGPLSLLAVRLFNEAANFVRFLFDRIEDLPQLLQTVQNGLLSLLSFLPAQLYNSASSAIIELFGDLQGNFDIARLGINFDTLRTPLQGLMSAARSVPAAILAIFIGIIATFFMTKDYRMITGFINRQMPENQRYLLPEIKNAVLGTLVKMFRAYGLIMFITFTELYIGLNLFKLLGFLDIDYLLVICMGIAVFDILPVLGAGGVLLPWAAYAFMTQNIPLGIALIVLYLVILAFRQYLEPKVVGDQLGVPPIVTLAGLYFGLRLFGFVGLFIVPVCIMCLKALNDTGKIKIWNKATPIRTEEERKQDEEEKKKHGWLRFFKKK